MFDKRFMDMSKRPLKIFFLFTLIFVSNLYSQEITEEMRRYGQGWCKSDDFVPIGGNTCLPPVKKTDVITLNDINVSNLRIRHSRITKGRAFISCDYGNRELIEISGPFNAFTTKTIEKLLPDFQSCNKDGNEN